MKTLAPAAVLAGLVVLLAGCGHDLVRSKSATASTPSGTSKARVTMKRSSTLFLGAACGILWWVISVALGASAYGVLGAHALTGAVSGAFTGFVISALSIPVYRRAPVRSLLWYSPLSVYLAIAVYGAAVFVVRSLTNDFHPDQIRWAVGLQSILGMWWGITVLAPIAIPVHLLAYGNHRLLRSLELSRLAGLPPPTPRPRRLQEPTSDDPV